MRACVSESVSVCMFGCVLECVCVCVCVYVCVRACACVVCERAIGTNSLAKNQTLFYALKQFDSRICKALPWHAFFFEILMMHRC